MREAGAASRYHVENPVPVGRFENSSALMGEPVALRARFDETGYLFLRGVLDRDILLAIRARWVAELQREGFMDADENWTGKKIDEVDEDRMHEVLGYDELWSAPSTVRLYNLVIDGPIWVFRQVAIRMVPPTVGEYVLPPHQDGTYIGPTQEFVNVWAPFDEISPETRGGVTLAAGSHRGGAREHVLTDRSPFKLGGIASPGVPAELVPEPWLAGDFKPGDLLFFKPYSVHAGLPNLTERNFRLSMDTRIQPFAAPRGHYARHTASEHKKIIREAGTWPEETPESTTFNV